MVARLERHIGVRLLMRSSRALALTDEGREYHERMGELLAQVEALEAGLGARARAPSGRLRVDMHVSLARQVVCPALPDFLKRHPDIAVDISITDRVVDMTSEGIDLKLGIGQVRGEDVVVRPLGVLRLVTCASPRYLARRGTPRKPEDLANHDCVVYRQSSGRLLAWQFERDGQPWAFTPPAQVTADQIDGLLDLAAAGVGLVRVAELEARRHLAARQVVRVLRRYECDGPMVHAVYPPARHMPAKTRAFVDWVTERLAKP
jgi:DNA-binding transcriptional LysR family regulator